MVVFMLMRRVAVLRKFLDDALKGTEAQIHSVVPMPRQFVLMLLEVVGVRMLMWVCVLLEVVFVLMLMLSHAKPELLMGMLRR